MNSWREAIEQYDEFLNEIYPPVRFGELEYSPARVLLEVDPIAYRIGLHEYVDSLQENDGVIDPDSWEDTHCIP